jgi:hypothetical protein
MNVFTNIIIKLKIIGTLTTTAGMKTSIITKLKENNMINTKCGLLKLKMNNPLQQIMNRDFKPVKF